MGDNFLGEGLLTIMLGFPPDMLEVPEVIEDIKTLREDRVLTVLGHLAEPVPVQGKSGVRSGPINKPQRVRGRALDDGSPDQGCPLEDSLQLHVEQRGLCQHNLDADILGTASEHPQDDIQSLLKSLLRG